MEKHKAKTKLVFFLGFFSFPILVFALVTLGLFYLSAPMSVQPLPLAERLSVDVQALKDHVVALTGTAKPRNSDNVASLNSAALYIEKKFQELGLNVVRQSYLGPNGQLYHNLTVLILPGPDGILTSMPFSASQAAKNFSDYLKQWPRTPVVVIGAHYDVCGEQMGADDNASGIAGLIELAKALVHSKKQLKYPVNLVAFTLEEPNYYDTEWMGSYVYAKSLKDNAIAVHGMLSLEMIGYFSDKKGSQNYPISMLGGIYGDVGNFIGVIGRMDQMEFTGKIKKAYLRASDLPAVSINAPEFIEGIDYSDHRSFWKMGYQAVMISDTSFFRNQNYHKVTDRPETLDYERMAAVVRGTYQAVVYLQE